MTIGSGGNDRYLYTDQSILDLNGGTLYGNAATAAFELRQDAGMTIYGDAYGARILTDFDGTVDGFTYGLYLETTGSGAGTDYGIYQATSGVDNYFAGNVGIGTDTPNGYFEVIAGNSYILLDDYDGASNQGFEIFIDQGGYSNNTRLQMDPEQGVKIEGEGFVISSSDAEIIGRSNGDIMTDGYLGFTKRSSNPPALSVGEAKMWLSDGTGTGDYGDLMITIRNPSSTKTTTLVDFSAI